MRGAHREAARILYEERNKDAEDSQELYVDLHGMLFHTQAALSMPLTSLQAYIQMNQCRISRAFFSHTAHPHVLYTP